jgi:type I restriction enzyme R subunit
MAAVAASGQRLQRLFATASIEAARIYYNQFGWQQQDLPQDQRLKIGLIYSYAANEAVGRLL